MDRSCLPLDVIVAAIADGQEIDWDAFRQLPLQPRERELLAHFEAIDVIGRFYRRQELSDGRSGALAPWDVDAPGRVH